MMQKNSASFVDFCKIYGLSKMILVGHASDIYNGTERLKVISTLIPEVGVDQFNFLPYPPFAYILFLPIASLPLIPAYGLWCSITLIFGLSGILVLRRFIAPGDQWQTSLLCLLLVSSSVCCLNNMLLGQSAWLMLGLICFYFVSLAKNLRVTCGVLVAICTIKFQFLLLVLVPLLVQRNWKALFTAFAIVTCFVVTTVSLLGVDTVRQYPALLAMQERDFPLLSLQINFRGLLYSLFPQIDHATTIVMSLAGFGFIAWLWVESKNQTKLFHAMSLSTLAYLICSPHVFFYDGLLLAIPILVNLGAQKAPIVAQIDAEAGPDNGPSSLQPTISLHHLYLWQKMLLLSSTMLGWLGYCIGNWWLARTILCIATTLAVIELKIYYRKKATDLI